MELEKLEQDLGEMIAREYGMPSNSLALANHTRLAKINDMRTRAGLPLARIEGFKLITT